MLWNLLTDPDAGANAGDAGAATQGLALPGWVMPVLMVLIVVAAVVFFILFQTIMDKPTVERFDNIVAVAA